MSAATSPGTGLAYGLRRVCAAWGMARSSFYAMTSGQHEQPPAKRRGPKPAISDQALLAIAADLIGIALGSRATARWARLRVCRDQSGCSAWKQSALAPSLPPPWRSRGMNQLDSRPHVGQPMAFGCSRLGLDLDRRALERRTAGMSASALRPLRRPAADLHGACRAVWLDRGRRGSGAVADGSAPSICRTTSPTRSSSGAQPSYAFVAEPQTNRRERIQSLAEGTDHPWSQLPCNMMEAAPGHPRLVELYNAQWIVEKNGYLSPLKLVRRGTPRSQSARRVDKLVSKERVATQETRTAPPLH